MQEYTLHQIRRTLLISFLLLTILSFRHVYAQETDSTAFSRENYAIFLKGGVPFNFYTANFNQCDGIVPKCGQYEGGSGIGYSVSAGYEYPLNWTSHISLGIGIIDRSGIIESANSMFHMQRNPNDWGVDTILTGSELEAALSYIEIQPDFRYLLVNDFLNGPLRVFGGPRIAVPISKSYTQSLVVESPEHAAFILPDGSSSKRKVNAEGDFEDNINPVLFGISLGIENMLKAGDDFMITQQLVFDYNFMDVLNDADWGIYAVRLEAGLRFASNRVPPKQMIIPPPPPDAPFPDAPRVDSVLLVEEIIEALPKPEINVSITEDKFKLNTGNELLATMPLVNAVFFDKSSKKIPEFYVTENVDLPDLFSGDAIDIHKYVLPRIVKILKENPEATILLEGATSGKYERGGAYLGTMRAQAVRDVLINLGIDESRISLKGRRSPKFKSNPAFKIGAIENQRVDLFVENAPLQEYVAMQKFAELTGYYKTKAEFVHANPDSGAVMLSTSFPDSTIRIMKSGEEHKYSFDHLRINPQSGRIDLEANLDFFEYNANDFMSIPFDSIPTEIVDLVLSKFVAVIRFDYNSSELSVDNQGLLKQMSDFLPAGTTVIVFGSADAIGPADYNTQLANDRAFTTIQYIQEVSGKKFNIEQSIDDTKYPEETQQGRFLNRSIRVRVRR